MTARGVHVPEPDFRSLRCVIGQHARCRDFEPRDSGVPGVHHLVCACLCHPLRPELPGEQCP